MKKIFLPLTTCLFLVFIIYSCQKQDSITPPNKFDAAAAKEWYYGIFKKSEEYKSALSTSGIKKYPDWKYGIAQTHGDYQIVEFPLKSTVRTVRVFSNPAYSEADKRRIVTATVERVVMIKDANGNITPRIVTYIPDLDYLAKHNYDISENKVTQIDNDFNGYLFIRTWHGGFINGFKIYNGRITRKLAAELKPANKQLKEEGSCTWTYNDNYTLYFAGHVEGDAVVWDYMSVDYQGTSDWVFQGCDGLSISPNFDPCGYGVCGGGGSTGSGGSGNGFPYEPTLYNGLGDRPIHEYLKENRCQGLQDMWNNYTNNEALGYVTADGKLIITDILPISGGEARGLYTYYNSATHTNEYYYTYPMSAGAPSQSYAGMTNNGQYYFIPIVASVHTHSQCRTDGTDGVSQDVSPEDNDLATNHPGLRNWVIGCGAIAQFDDSNSYYTNIQNGSISTTCSTIN